MKFDCIQQANNINKNNNSNGDSSGSGDDDDDTKKKIVKNSSHVELLNVEYDNGSIVFDYECHAQSLKKQTNENANERASEY